MKRFSILKLMFALALSVFIAPAVGQVLGVAPAWCAVGLTALSFVPTHVAGALGMAVQVEIWEKDIEEAIFEDNSFLNDAVNADQYVLAGKVVHISQSGGPGNVVKNRANLPANVTKRSDTDVTYALDEYTTDPILISDAEKSELSYDKRNSAIGEEKSNLAQTVAEELLYDWAKDLPDTSIVATSGKEVSATSEGATGKRLSAVLADLQAARTLLSKQGRLAKGKMVALIPSDMLAQLFPAGDAVAASYAQNLTEEERREGVLYRAHGFNIKERGSVLRYGADGTLKAPGAIGEAGDCEGILCWNKGAVERAKGEVKMFQNEGDPQYYGDIYSFLVRMGGRRRRADSKGVVVIRQKTVAA